MKIKTLTLALILTLQIAGPDSFAQEGKKVVNEDGWTVPGVADLDSMRLLNKSELIIEEKRIRMSYSAKEGNRRDVIKFQSIYESNDVIKYREIEIQVLGIVQFDINGKPFCYEVNMGLVHNGIGVLTAYSFAYYDEDGRGIFGTREELGPRRPGIPRVRLPEWVKNLSQTR